MASIKYVAGLALAGIILIAVFNGCIENANVNGATVSVDKNAYAVEIIAPADHDGQYVVDFHYQGITHGSWAGYLGPGATKKIIDERPLEGNLIVEVRFNGVSQLF